MAALTNVRDTSELGGKYIALPVKGATTIYQGAIVAVDANGYAIPGKKAADLKAAGRAEETVENKGGDGDAVIRVSRGTFVFENSTSGKITAAAYTGPASGPRPASSTPQIVPTPPEKNPSSISHIFPSLIPYPPAFPE